MNRSLVLSFLATVALFAPSAWTDVKVVVNHNDNSRADKEFAFTDVPPPATDDLAAKLRFSLTDGERDGNGAGLRTLTDGMTPDEGDQPGANFFFAQGTDGGLLAIDLGQPMEISQVNTYSWHPSTRGPQVYTLYASDGATPNFDPKPKRPATGVKLEDKGWKRIAEVNTRGKNAKGDGAMGEPGGQYGVSIGDSAGGALGTFRYLILDVRTSGTHDRFGNTFYSEIDVVGKPGAAATIGAGSAGAKVDPSKPMTFRTRDRKYEVTLDVSESPELAGWASEKLAPVLVKWYPIIVEMLPSDGYAAPEKFNVIFKSAGKGVAATGGTTVTCAADWFKKNQDGEAIGAVVHELVHVAQQYGASRQAGQGGRAPGWLTEGIADYIRWYRYEPESRGAAKTPADAKYDASYRVSANFLNYVTERYDKQIVRKLNAALREGKPVDTVWTDSTGKAAEELGREWKDQLPK